MTVVTRFAPSPTGFLHIGGVRTALFNWLFARHNNGKFLLRIEDTDRKRSTDEAIDAILDGMKWLGLDWDGESVSQFANTPRHAEVAKSLIATGNAYYCYLSPEELTVLREESRKTGKPIRSPWRDADPSTAPKDIQPVIRVRMPQEGSLEIEDLIQGKVKVNNQELDDMVLLRSDGTPTYMLAVVVDDHDMNVTHVIRGDDHLNNAFRQVQLYNACGWQPPKFSHIPLIHGADGAKLSKRHGALGVDAYRDMGLLPDAILNYLVRLGWGHGDNEIISREQAKEWFTLEAVGKSPSKFDMTKMEFINAHYLKQTPPEELYGLMLDFMDKDMVSNISDEVKTRLITSMPWLVERAKTLPQLAETASFLTKNAPLTIESELLTKIDDNGKKYVKDIHNLLKDCTNWDHDSIKSIIDSYMQENELKFGKIGKPLRLFLTGQLASAGKLFDVLEVLGKDEVIQRLNI